MCRWRFWTTQFVGHFKLRFTFRLELIWNLTLIYSKTYSVTCIPWKSKSSIKIFFSTHCIFLFIKVIKITIACLHSFEQCNYFWTLPPTTPTWMAKPMRKFPILFWCICVRDSFGIKQSVKPLGFLLPIDYIGFFVRILLKKLSLWEANNIM